MSHLGLHLGDQVLLGLLGGEAGDALQHFRLAALDDLDLLVFLVDGRVLLGQGLFLLFNGLGLAVEVFFLLLQAVFLPLQVGSACLFFLLVLAAAFQNLFLCFQQGLALFGLCALDGLVDNACALFLGTGNFLLRDFFPITNTEREADGAADHQAQQGRDDGIHRDLPPHCRYWFFADADRAAVPARSHGQKTIGPAPLSPPDDYLFLV